jgi:hypothetical protein
MGGGYLGERIQGELREREAPELQIIGGGSNGERERERVLVEERKNGEEERVPVAAEPLYREGHQPHWRPTVLQGH